MISVKIGNGIGIYDLDNIEGDIVFRKGNSGEKYQGIGKDLINIEDLPVFSDDIGAFGSPKSDSTRTMITEKSKNMVLVISSFKGKRNLNSSMDLAEKFLVDFVRAKILNKEIINN